MYISVIGTGYVGLVSGTCFAESGHNVVNIDVDENKIQMLKKLQIPIYEPGLEELVKKNVKEKRLEFTTSLQEGVAKSDIHFIAVGTPSKEDNSADLSYVEEAAKSIGKALTKKGIIVLKSTVPVGTAAKVKKILQQYAKHPFEVVSNPEFLKEGTAVEDFMKPDRVVIGTSCPKTAEIMKELYAPFVRTGNPIYVMDNQSAEITKYASNAYLATRISFINEIALLCEKAGANVNQVREAMGADTRIGKRFLFPGLGFGGSCFPKDVRAIIQTAKECGLDFKIVQAALEVNTRQRLKFVDKILQHFQHNIQNKTFAIWGLSFKPRTDDIREAPSLTIIEKLLQNGAKIQAYDPEAVENTKNYFQNNLDHISFTNCPYKAAENADALLLITEWKEFHQPDFSKLHSLLKQPLIFDGRNMYNPEKMKERGFQYYCIGVAGH
ncbi:MAG: UDP-glucose/GDP-mannose dehydrogenase family protein [Planctomycetota bacterium]|nr:MAG: UDP-glucose/GDP-mannose dehydrogenase family protein [Planctomycetota bacterium]